MRSIFQLAQEQKPLGPEVYAAADHFLDQLLLDLYRRSSGHALKVPLPIPVLDDIDQAYPVLRDAKRFLKNYDFLHRAMPGRFSANLDEWRVKVKLTQGFYSDAIKRVPTQFMAQAYTEHLLRPAEKGSVFGHLVSAAVTLVSKAFGFPHTLPYPMDLIDNIRAKVVFLQATNWVSVPQFWQEQTFDELKLLTDELFFQWQQDPATLSFLTDMAHRCFGTLLEAQKELLQNLFAATETTASSLCWMIDVLSRNDPRLQVELCNDEHVRQRFINECLRLFPPVPMVTRVCVSVDSSPYDRWKPGQSLAVSVVGLHTQAGSWSNPLRFDHQRVEWQQDPPSSFLPFLYGPRICGGRKLAMEELTVGLMALLRLFHIESSTGPVRFRYSLTSRPFVTPTLHLKAHG